MTPDSIGRSEAVAPVPDRAPAAFAADAYQHNWDRLRAIGYLDIVGSHLTGTHSFGGIGLPMFFVIAIALPLRRPQPIAALARGDAAWVGSSRSCCSTAPRSTCGFYRSAWWRR